jgi:tetratricopeptide (TPR) repeat protein
MHFLLSYTRSIFWITGIIQIVVGLFVLAALFGKRQRPILVIVTVVAGLLVVAFGALCCQAARALRHKKRFSRTVVAIASICNLIVFPFGTVAGATGLYWCFSSKTRELQPLVEDFEYQPKPGDGTRRWMQMAVPVIGIVIWFGSMGVTGYWGEKHGLPRDAAMNGLLLLFICEWISAFFHEMGHAIAGWAVDMRVVHFAVGPIVATKQGGKWKFQFSLLALAGAGGAVASAPLHLKNLRRRMAVEIAAGPFASLLTALGAFWILTWIPGSAMEAWWKVPAVVAAMSAGATVINLIPFGFAAGFSDGALLVQLRSGGPFADLREALKMIGATTVTTNHLRDLDAAALSHGLRAGIGTPQEATLRSIQLVCAVAREELTVARELLEINLERHPTPDKEPDAGCAAEMAFYIAYLDGDASRAGQWLDGAERLAVSNKTPLTNDFDYWKAVMVVREAQGRKQEADGAWERAVELVAKKPQNGLYQFERELLQKARSGEWLRAEDVPSNQAELGQAQGTELLAPASLSLPGVGRGNSHAS